MKKYGFLITAYKQIELVRENINRIRNNYKILNNSDIIIVTTSEEDIGFKSLEEYENVHVIEYKNAPPMLSFCDLSKRIFNSIQFGLYMAKELEIDCVLHLHSDTYWEIHKENILFNYMNIVLDDNLLFSGDIDIHCEFNSPIPPNIHFHPEGIIFNIKECLKYGYGFTFDRIWKNDGFISHNICSPEALIGQYAIFCLSSENVIKSTDVIPYIYFQKIKIRNYRTYHGIFDDGLINLKTKQ